MAEEKAKKPKKKQLGGGGKMPSKTSINLLIIEKHTTQNLTALLGFVVFMAALAVFVKIMVIDQIAEVNRLEARYNQQENILESLQDANSVYEQVRAEHSHFGNSYLNDEELILQDRLDILKVIEEELLEQDALQSIVINGNVAQLKINSSKLRNVSEIVASLEDRKNVEYVTVTNSVTDEIETYVSEYDEMYAELYDALYASLRGEDETEELEDIGSDAYDGSLVDEYYEEDTYRPMSPEHAQELSAVLGAIFAGMSGQQSTAVGIGQTVQPETQAQTAEDNADADTASAGIIGADLLASQESETQAQPETQPANYGDDLFQDGDRLDPEEVVIPVGSVNVENLQNGGSQEEFTGEAGGVAGLGDDLTSQPETQAETEIETEMQTQPAVNTTGLAGLASLFGGNASQFVSEVEAEAETQPATEPVTRQEKVVVTTMTIYFKSAVQLAAEAAAEAETETETDAQAAQAPQETATEAADEAQAATESGSDESGEVA